MKKWTLLLLSAFLMLLTAGCLDHITRVERVKPSDRESTRTEKLEPFSRVSLVGPFDMVFSQETDGQPRMQIEGPDNFVNLLDIIQNGEEVVVRVPEGYSFVMNNQKLVVKVYSAELDYLSVTGSGVANVKPGLKTDSLTLSVTGSGKVKAINVTCEGNFETSVTGSGLVSVDGMRCDNIKNNVTGSGTIKVTGSESTSVKALVTGSGHITVGGQSDEAKFCVLGSGVVDAADLKAERVEKETTGSGNIITK